jgi:hypothetical protein
MWASTIDSFTTGGVGCIDDANTGATAYAYGWCMLN